jgi:oligoribonuclease
MAKKEAIIDRFVWIDCEMTGLDITKDVLLEIATIITDGDLNIIAEGPDIVIHQPEAALAHMIPVVQDLHTKSGLIDEVKKSTISLTDAQERTFLFIQQHCEREKAVLAGNSVWQDGMFLRKYMPRITDYLNYRIVDVSSLKVLVRQWYPNDPHVKFKKTESHRALTDIRESIAELKWYKKYFFTLGG